MHRLWKPRSLLLALLVLMFVAALTAAQQWRLFERGWFFLQQNWQTKEGQAGALWLPDYRVVIEAQPLLGLAEVSALTFDPHRNSLFTVTNKNSELIELSLSGEVLRRIPLTGFGDAEAVEYISPGVYVISDERQQRLYRVHVDPGTLWLDAVDSEQLSLGLGRNGNKGFEGLAYDRVGKRLFVAKERDPIKIIEIQGFPRVGAEPSRVVDITDDKERDKGLFVRDLSSLDFDEGTGHLLALSDESRLVLELDVDGKPVSSLSLLAGMSGLKHGVPQAEGVATDGQGTLYLVSEPNLFYLFRKPVVTQAGSADAD